MVTHRSVPFAGALALTLALLGAGCGGTPALGEDTGQGLVLQVTGGSYEDGSGRVGLALLATLRDAGGHAPTESWTGALSDSRGPLGVNLSYPVGGEGGSYGAFWWPDVGFAPGETYALTLTRGDGATLSAHFVAPGGAGLAVPEVDLTPDGERLDWAPVSGAQGYGCEVYAAGNLQLGVSSASPGCDVSALPTGSYSASVTAFGASWDALRADAAQRPKLPAAFHVSEGQFAFARGASGTTARAAATGGGFFYGRVQPGLAVWLSLTRADGTPFAASAPVEVVGPGLSADAPLRFTYPANATHYLLWSYDAQALQGTYTLSASVDGQRLSTRFTLAEPAPLAAPANASATPASSGGARVVWDSVATARSYYVSAWDRAGTFVAGQWSATPDVRFGSGTFSAGKIYDVYVAATDVDESSVSRPERLSVSENTYLPASFTAQ
ncbi:hypothetical protein FGE12_02970 [Aggregicoccus sp. 17bor-14]|uniref:hypothetical protein n=1 Tax=Myxococcaceae TaxID=31 RepID=UPI00129D0086|nr:MULTISPECIES: hypothetical protein [Myxococcaceae]MBF5041333.1 hypothetical protein [Simulacricoccus sp. 17bor-14]MRI87119.1 hypothetical protein [Aggregicoccus sp. 17bor-14]